MQDLEVEEGGPAELLCQYSRPVQAKWKMNEQEVCADGHRIIIEQDWTVARLSFRPALPRDSGIYSCEAAGTRVVALLRVQGEARGGPWPCVAAPAGSQHEGQSRGAAVDSASLIPPVQQDKTERWGELQAEAASKMPCREVEAGEQEGTRAAGGGTQEVMRLSSVEEAKGSWSSRHR